MRKRCEKKQKAMVLLWMPLLRCGKMKSNEQYTPAKYIEAAHEARFIDIFQAFGTVARRVSVPKPTPIMLELF